MEWCLGVASVIDSVDLCDCFIDYRYRWESVILVGMRTEAIGAGAGGEPTVTEGGSWRTRRFLVPLIWAAVPTLLVTSLICFFWRYYEPPEFLVGVLFFGLVIPAAVICEKLGFGEFSILGGSTVPDWLFFSVMMVLMYLYSLLLVMAGRGVVRLALQARRTVRGDWWKTGWVR
jgi:hypothetical protein